MSFLEGVGVSGVTVKPHKSTERKTYKIRGNKCKHNAAAAAPQCFLEGVGVRGDKRETTQKSTCEKKKTIERKNAKHSPRRHRPVASLKPVGLRVYVFMCVLDWGVSKAIDTVLAHVRHGSPVAT
jgi:hypothetical protein